jgi:hypothetical protein
MPLILAHSPDTGVVLGLGGLGLYVIFTLWTWVVAFRCGIGWVIALIFLQAFAAIALFFTEARARFSITVALLGLGIAYWGVVGLDDDFSKTKPSNKSQFAWKLDQLMSARKTLTPLELEDRAHLERMKTATHSSRASSVPAVSAPATRPLAKPANTSAKTPKKENTVQTKAPPTTR